MSDNEMRAAAESKLPAPPKAPSFGPSRTLYTPAAEVAQGETVAPKKKGK